jgi:predicted DNA-binding transcriptional regulator AlpA
VSSPVDAADAEAATLQLADTITTAFPGAIAVRVDQDLVSIPDIAERTDRSRESVRLLVEAKRGPGGFPAPVGTVGDGIRVWPWASVLDWVTNTLGEDLGERGVPPEVAAVVDASLLARRQHVRRPAHVT